MSAWRILITKMAQHGKAAYSQAELGEFGCGSLRDVIEDARNLGLIQYTDSGRYRLTPKGHGMYLGRYEVRQFRNPQIHGARILPTWIAALPPAGSMQQGQT